MTQAEQDSTFKFRGIEIKESEIISMKWKRDGVEFYAEQEERAEEPQSKIGFGRESK